MKYLIAFPRRRSNLSHIVHSRTTSHSSCSAPPPFSVPCIFLGRGEGGLLLSVSDQCDRPEKRNKKHFTLTKSVFSACIINLVGKVVSEVDVSIRRPRMPT